MRIKLNTRSTTKKLSDRRATFKLNDRRSKVHLNLDVVPTDEEEAVLNGFDYTLDFTL
jgi:hypothetical protein